MGYGVMVTLQILVLSFLVRIQVAQQKRGKVDKIFTLFLLYHYIGISGSLKKGISHLSH